MRLSANSAAYWWGTTQGTVEVREAGESTVNHECIRDEGAWRARCLPQPHPRQPDGRRSSYHAMLHQVQRGIINITKIQQSYLPRKNSDLCIQYVLYNVKYCHWMFPQVWPLYNIWSLMFWQSREWECVGATLWFAYSSRLITEETNCKAKPALVKPGSAASSQADHHKLTQKNSLITKKHVQWHRSQALNITNKQDLRSWRVSNAKVKSSLFSEKKKGMCVCVFILWFFLYEPEPGHCSAASVKSTWDSPKRRYLYPGKKEGTRVSTNENTLAVFWFVVVTLECGVWFMLMPQRELMRFFLVHEWFIWQPVSEGQLDFTRVMVMVTSRLVNSCASWMPFWKQPLTK